VDRAERGKDDLRDLSMNTLQRLVSILGLTVDQLLVTAPPGTDGPRLIALLAEAGEEVQIAEMAEVLGRTPNEILKLRDEMQPSLLACGMRLAGNRETVSLETRSELVNQLPRSPFPARRLDDDDMTILLTILRAQDRSPKLGIEGTTAKLRERVSQMLSADILGNDGPNLRLSDDVAFSLEPILRPLPPKPANPRRAAGRGSDEGREYGRRDVVVPGPPAVQRTVRSGSQ
jgi:hypothetical protein